MTKRYKLLKVYARVADVPVIEELKTKGIGPSELLRIGMATAKEKGLKKRPPRNLTEGKKPRCPTCGESMVALSRQRGKSAKKKHRYEKVGIYCPNCEGNFIPIEKVELPIVRFG